jgi:biopolymer transport protein ExbB/TolQ
LLFSELATDVCAPARPAIKSFGAVGNDEGGNKSTELAKGISEALNCTAFGIGTSLVGLLGYSLLQGKTVHVTDDINEVTVQVVNLVTTHRAQMQPQA